MPNSPATIESTSQGTATLKVKVIDSSAQPMRRVTAGIRMSPETRPKDQKTGNNGMITFKNLPAVEYIVNAAGEKPIGVSDVGVLADGESKTVTIQEVVVPVAGDI